MNRVLSIVALVVCLAASVFAQGGAPTTRERGRAIEGMIGSSGDAALHTFAETNLAPSYVASFATPEALLDHLREIRHACANFGGILANPLDDGGIRMTFMMPSGQTSLIFKTQPDGSHLITAIDLDGSAPASPPEVAVAPVTWDNLASRLDEETAAGFSGTVLVVHGGKIVLHTGYGLANREKSIPNSTETIFAIGSVPIDFTRAAILKLEETGRLHTSDAITTFLHDVPADKRGITLAQLMSGKSGLPNFHHIPDVDADYDLSWIDRETAIHRILGATLLFPPGEGQAHSHSAWVLLAAIVEIVSGQSYGDFLKQNFFDPAGMTRTGLHEDAARFPDDAFAVGYEGKSVGSINIPKYWGKTSWLVMGSGGMESTPMDLYRWLAAIRAGKTLAPAAAAKYWHGGALAGGDDRGFFCLYTEGPNDMFVMCTNGHGGPGDRASAVGRRLFELVTGRPVGQAD